ncbi:hypothetical protein [Sandarakinorhabdus sp.]|uniref:hypothetical protein n=1 Tax=Sandarakinorhabdus sp. TaxID=1916663 RepID=UPI00286DEFFF|nr:hypothetical protein [Sandarakinorhabdus sp.]
MTISTSDQLINALANGPSRIVIDKASIANQAAGGFTSLWRATGQPAQGAIPGTVPGVPTHLTAGAVAFNQQTAPATSYIGWLFATSSNSAMTLEIHDRLAHVGGLVLNVITPQAITGLDLGGGGLNLEAARRGDANFSDIQWWLEVYADGGATASNATINVTYNDSSTGNLNVIAVGGTIRAGRMFPLTPLIPAGDQGKFIRAINSVTLSASTTVAGNFGFTATRPRTAVPLALANFTQVSDFAALNLPEVPNNSCLMLLLLTSAAATGTLRGGGKIMHG